MNESAFGGDRPRSAAVFIFLAMLLVAGGALTLAVAWRKSFHSGSASSGDGAAAASAVPNPQPPGADVDWLTEYTLTDQQGESFGTSDLEGRVSVTSFFFASCPGPCRQENLCVRDLHDEFGKQGVVFVSITCDPEHDTPDVLQKYSQMFNANPQHWKFLTGDLLYIRRIGAEIFGLPVGKQTHSEDMIVTDRWGKIRGRYHWNNPQQVAQMKLDLAALLAEKQPPPEVPAAGNPPAEDADAAKVDEDR